MKGKNIGVAAWRPYDPGQDYNKWQPGQQKQFFIGVTEGVDSNIKARTEMITLKLDDESTIKLAQVK